ncbi:MAG: T9SS type A sorting domain-containing protein, partial [Candidatus Kapabacteria bacterium]|nr:T9SS type A sorting domain-containing protein [Candidatus Kapabacteria bacterium]
QSAGSVIEIVNTLGVNVRTMQIDEAGVVERSIDLRGLASGVYAVRIQSGGRVRMTRSFVKSH